MKEKARHHITAYILAGGKSSRMGEDKGLMLFKGQAVVQYVIDTLKQVTGSIVIVSNSSAYKDFGLEVIRDEIKNIGAAGGILTALHHSKTERNFIVSCDMPFINKEAIQYLLENCASFDITVPEHKQQLEPLFGVYHKECYTRWKNITTQGQYTLHTILETFTLQKLNVDGNSSFSDLAFLNLNTRAEFDSALKLLQ